MGTLVYIDIAIAICIIYLILLLRNKRFRLLAPCTIHSITWLIAAILIHLTITGEIGHYYEETTDVSNRYDYVAPFILGIVVASILGFTIAHIYLKVHDNVKLEEEKTHIEYIETITKRFKWILYVCLAFGIAQFYFVYSLVGFENLEEYRLAAVTLERFGLGSFVQSFSGHATILGTFYFALVGYKHAYRGINFREFIIDALFLSAANIALAGRLWIVTSLLPYFVTYFWQLNRQGIYRLNKNFSKVAIVLVILLAFFSYFGSIRNDVGSIEERSFADKFLYYTDGSRMTNMTMSSFPEGTFKEELGKSEFLSKWLGSPMQDNYKKMVSHDRGLAVTVQSSMIPLYFDFGRNGGIIMWGIFCLILEILSMILYTKKDIIAILLFLEVSKILFLAPIFPIFITEIPTLLWIVILYIFRKKLFGIPNGE